MLVLRTSQREALSSGQEASFLLRMTTHLRGHFPGATAGLDRETLLGLTRAALHRARSFGLASERDLCLYLNLCAELGWELEEKEENGWVAETLGDGSYGDPGDRLRWIYGEALRRQGVEAANERRRASFLA